MRNYPWLMACALGACQSNAELPNTPKRPPPSSPLASELLSEAHIEAGIRRAFDYWYGVYIAGRKVGYARATGTPEAAGGYRHHFILHLEANGDVQEQQQTTLYGAGPAYPTLRVDVVESSQAGRVERHYQRTAAGWALSRTQDGVTDATRQLPATCDDARSMLLTFGLSGRHLKPGQSAEYCAFDIDEERDEIRRVRVSERKQQVLSGVAVRVAVLEESSAEEPVPTTFEVTDEGLVLVARMGQGVALRLEEQLVAQSEIEGFDIFSSAIQVRPIRNPRASRELSLIVGVTPGFRIPEGPNQSVAARPDGRFDVTVRALPGAAVTQEERREALRATSEVDFEHAGIRALASELTAGVTTPADKVAALVRWVSSNMEATLTTNLTTASQVLAQRSGDCTEHTLLFLALARAVGIPAQEVSGVLYADELGGFGWHAWAEVELDGHWVAVDPSWDQVIADATHLKLGAGDNDQAGATIGALQIEVR